MYSTIEHIFFSTMPNYSDLFRAKENPENVNNLEIEIKPAFQFQNHFHHHSIPNCSESPTSFDSMVLVQSSTWLENPISNRNQSQIDQKNSSQYTLSRVKKEEKKKEEEGGGGGYEEADLLSLLLSKGNYKPSVEEEEEDEEEDGFRTPTTSDHRILEPKQCPPAPRKPKPSLKRKAPHSHTSTPLHLSPEEVQLLFPTQHKPPSNSHRITCKKVRRDYPK